MTLWIFYSPGNDAQTLAACEAALEVLKSRGVSPSVAANASLDMASSEDTAGMDAYVQDAVAAWYAAEDAAFHKLFEVTGQWPEQAALIWSTGTGG
jgi:hypothetical protein